MVEVAFSVPGAPPSKSNYRKSKTKASHDAWERIVRYQQEVAMAAMVAGAKRYCGSGRAVVKMLLVNQRIDCDNASKAPLDGLKGVAFPDDGPKHLRGVQSYHADPDGSGPRVEFRISWEQANEGSK